MIKNTPLVPMHKHLFIVFLLFMGATGSMSAQKAMQMEKRGSLQTDKFFVGDVLVYKYKSGPHGWLTERITDIHIEDKYVEFENRIVQVDSIYAIREAVGKGARPISALLKGFGISWSFWTGVSLLFRDTPSLEAALIGPGSYLVGHLLKLAFFKTHRIGKRKRLRLIDLTFGPKSGGD